MISPSRFSAMLLGGIVAVAWGCTEDAESPTAPENSPALAASTAAPLSFRQLSAGYRHTCGITTDNRAYCWGDNFNGGLGDGTTQYRTTPVAVSGGLRFLQVSGGLNYTCGVTTDFKAYCWGQNTYGKLGDGSATRRLAPAAVFGTRRFRQVDAGLHHTCGVTTAGIGYCWGNNIWGQLGDGSTFNQRQRPVPIAGGLLFLRVIAGGTHTCGLTRDNQAYCWGDNSSGQIGDGTTTNRWAPRHVALRRTWNQVGAGALDRMGTGHSCGVTTENQAYCWGTNEQGQLGNGTTIRSLRPAQVAGGLQFAGVSAGGDHNCGVATNHQAYCWGYNYYGQLGNGQRGDHDPSLAPVAVTGGLSFAAVSAGENHTCGITTGRRAYCWGGGRVLGNGSFEPSSTPVAVAAP